MSGTTGKRLGLSAAALALTGLCLAVMLQGVETAPLLGRVERVAPGPLIAAILLALGLPAWRALRLFWLADDARHWSFWHLWRISAEVLMWNFLLPFRLGELSFPVLLKRRLGTPLAEAAGLFLLIRLADLAAILAILLAGTALVLPGLLPLAPWLTLLLAGLVLASPALVALALRTPPLAGLRRRRATFEKLAAGAARARQPARLAGLIASSLALWGSHALIGVFTVMAVAPTAPAAAGMVAAAAGNLAFALPINGVLGLGPQQVAWTWVLARAGTPWSAAVGIALAGYLVVLGAALAAGVAAWLVGIWRPARPHG